MEFIYQIQIKRDSGWSPVINAVTGLSLEFHEYDEAHYMARMLSFHHSVRIVKYNFTVVKSF